MLHVGRRSRPLLKQEDWLLGQLRVPIRLTNQHLLCRLEEASIEFYLGLFLR